MLVLTRFDWRRLVLQGGEECEYLIDCLSPGTSIECGMRLSVLA